MKDTGKITQPLAGKRVLVTRAAHQAGKLSEGLRALGAEPVEVPVLEIAPPESYDPLDQALRSLSSYDWLILTSANTVRALADRAATLGLSLSAVAGFSVAAAGKTTATAHHLNVSAVGEATAEAAREAGLLVSVVPESYVAESLVAEVLRAAKHESADVLKGHGFSPANKPDVAPVSRPAVPAASQPPEASFRGQRFLIARAAVARDVIPDALRTARATVDVVDAYRNIMPEAAPALLREALQKVIDAAAFTSSSSVMHLADAARHAGIAFPFAGVAAISIGPITSKTLRELGWEPAAEATLSDVPGLLQAIARLLR